MSKQCPYKTGDVVEFQAYNWDGIGRGGANKVWVGRIRDIVYLQAEDKFELWMEYLCEVAGVDNSVTPEDVIRVIESSNNKPMMLTKPPISVGTDVVYIEDGKKILDKIESYQQCDQGFVSHKWSYTLKDSGYDMSDSEFQIVNIEYQADQGGEK